MNDRAFFVVWTTLVVGFLAVFIPVEAYAIATGRDKTDTLSAWVWARIGTRDGWRGWHIPLRLGVLVLFAWLAEHFAFGWF